MKLTVSTNNEKGYNQTNLAKDWQINEYEIRSEQDVRDLFCNKHYSHVEWRNGRRLGAYFMGVHFLVADYDGNLTLKEAQEKYKPYKHIIITSRNHQKVKKSNEELGKVDRFHVIVFLTEPIRDRDTYEALKDTLLFADADEKVFMKTSFLYKSPEDAKVFMNLDGALLDIKDLKKVKAARKINFTDVGNQKKIIYEYPQVVKDPYGNETPISYYEERALKVADLKNDSIEEGSLKFFCPVCDEHNSPSSYVVELEDGSFIIKDFKHPETTIVNTELLDIRCNDWYRIGANYSEIVKLESENEFRLTKRSKEDVLTRLGKDAPEYIIKKKSLADPVGFDFIGGSGEALSYKYDDDRFTAYAPFPEVELEDNAFIDAVLEQIFGKYSAFIKSWIAYYTYTNHKHLPVIILTGPRATGKSLFADMISMIYQPIAGRFDTTSVYTEHNGLKLAVIEEADEIDNKKLYSILKDVGGTDKLIKNVKYGPKTLVKNNLNVIVLSNNRIPIYLKANELPTDESNNQFFVYHLNKLKGPINNRLKYEIEQRIGHWLRTDIKDLYEKLKQNPDKLNNRYQIPVPVTDDELLLFENNKTESEIILLEFLEELKEDYIAMSDLQHLQYLTGINKHHLKRKLVDMAVIDSLDTHQAQRGLNTVYGGTKRSRYLKVSQTQKN